MSTIPSILHIRLSGRQLIGLERLPPGEARLRSMPEPDTLLTHTPAEEDPATLPRCREVHEPALRVPKDDALPHQRLDLQAKCGEGLPVLLALRPSAVARRPSPDPLAPVEHDAPSLPNPG